MRGCRERELKRTFHSSMQSMYESAARIHIEEGNKASIELTTPAPADMMEGAMHVEMEYGVPVMDKNGEWNRAVGERVDLSVLEQVRSNFVFTLVRCYVKTFVLGGGTRR